MVVLFGVSHAAAAPSLICLHASVEAHVAALKSNDSRIASEAHHEEAKAATAEKLASLSDKTSAAATGVLQDESEVLSFFEASPRQWVSAEPDRLNGRALAPLLQPPSA